MNNLKKINNDEVSLIELLETLWDGKWKIALITIITAMISIFYSLAKEDSFQVITTIQNGEQSTFIDYMAINDVLSENEILLTDQNSNGYLIDASTIFKLFVNEYNDYEEMINVLRSDEFIANIIKDLDKYDQERELIEYAKLFTITLPRDEKEYPILSFEWHDITDGTALLEKALEDTLQNVKSTLQDNIKKLATSLEMKNQRRLDELRNQMKLIEKKGVVRNEKRIQFLSEQSAIARELGIETNRLDANALSQTVSANGVSLNINSNDVPFYLRGFKAIEKEMSLIKNRSKVEQLLMSAGFIQVSEEILMLENDLSALQLRNTITVVKSDDPKDWIIYDLSLADNKSVNNPLLYLIVSIVIGATLGVVYVFIVNAFRKRREHA